jgi:hypothetical protein
MDMAEAMNIAKVGKVTPLGANCSQRSSADDEHEQH